MTHNNTSFLPVPTTFISGLFKALLLLVISLPAFAADEQTAITTNYQEADIREIIHAVSEITERTFIIDPRVKAQVTMVSSTPMTPNAFYEAFLSILQVYGFVAIESGDVVKIVPDTNARQLPTSNLSQSDGGDAMVTHVVQLDNVAAAQLVPMLRPLIPQYGHLAAHPSSNMLIISDRSDNIKRLLKIVNRIDQSSDADIEIIPLEHASAIDLSQTLTALNQVARGDAAAASPFSVVADDRTNSLILGGDKATRLRFRTLIAHLDTPLENGGNTQVVYLRYADAEEMSTKLREQVTQTTSNNNTNANSVTIWSDQDTNALVITAPPKTMRSLKSVIDQLDIRRAQVQIDTIIADMTDTDAISLGIDWASDGQSGNDLVGFTDLGGTSIQGVLGTLITGTEISTGDGTVTSLPSLPTGTNFAIGRFRENGTSFGALINTLASDTTTNILSRPTIITMDNEEAEISVGQEVPFITGSFTNNGANSSSVNPFQTIQRRDVGTKLKITPQINEGNAVILEIDLEVSSVSNDASATDIITNRRTIRQKIIVEDGTIIVLGGLIDEKTDETVRKVPLLGDIPLIGNLFRNQSTEQVKNNLMVFLRPSILRDGVDTQIASNAKYLEIRNQQLELGKRPNLMPFDERAVLPPLEDVLQLPPEPEQREQPFSDRFIMPEPVTPDINADEA